MDKLLLRIVSIIIVSLGWLYFIIPWSTMWMDLPLSGREYKLWLDLQGWVELDYKIDLKTVRETADYTPAKEDQIVEWLKSIIEKRIQTLKINDSVLTTSTYMDEKHIIVEIPMKWGDAELNKANIARAKDAIWKVVKIEFKEKRKQVTEADYKQRKDIAKNFITDLKKSKNNFTLTSDEYKFSNSNLITWVFNDSNSMSWLLVEPKKLKVWEVSDVITWSGFLSSTYILEKGYYVLFKKSSSEIDYVFVWANPSEWMAAKDKKGRVLNDKYFNSASVSLNQLSLPQVSLNFNSEWADIFWELTTRLVWEQIAIFVWWEMLTAPNVNEPILNWSAVITGDYDFESANKLANDINTWVVPAPIYLTSERSIDSKLWMDSLQKLILAWVVWFAIIFIFLVFAYRLSWALAWISLAIYLILLLTIVKLFWIVLTLAWIAWIILTLWMAIDANILILERTIEELQKSESRMKAIKIGFEKSFSAIWDSNVTWIIISIILYIFGVNMIKWFWLMMWLWLLLSVFTVLYISKLFTYLLFRNEKLSTEILIWKIKK